MKDEHIVIITEPNLTINIECPKCQRRGVANLSVIEYDCSKCNFHFTTKVQTTFKNFYIPIIFTKLSKMNYVKVCALDKFEKVLDEIRLVFLDHKSYEVTEIKKEEIEINKRRCNDCGFCGNCVKCNKCNHYFVPKIKKCPCCGHYKFRQSYVILEDGKCPKCGDDNITKTSFYNKDKCHLCGSQNITEKKKIKSNYVIIKRLKQFEIKDV